MRLALLCAIALAACESNPTIACNTDDQCLSGQHCASGICHTADETTPDGHDDSQGGSGVDGPRPLVDATIDAAPTCSPACSGSTPYCLGGACVQCRSALDCPLTAPSCSASHTCTL